MMFVVVLLAACWLVDCAPLKTASSALFGRVPRRGQAPGAQVKTPYTTAWFTQTLDHYNYNIGSQTTFSQRVLYSTKYFAYSGAAKCPGPIFFYTGNESPVTDYWDNSGFVIDELAKAHGAAIYFVEHRYFGETLPFGNNSWLPANRVYLSADQALADYAQFLTALKATMPWDCPVFSFGGSYGGMLTAWFRVKYPWIVMGGLAASAPVAFHNTPEYNQYAFMDSCEATYADADARCPPLIGQGLLSMIQQAQSPAGLAALSKAFRLCSPLQTYNDAVNLVQYIQSALVDMGMLDYPYPTNYGVVFPGWPVNSTCADIVAFPNDPIAGLASGLQNFYNSSGARPCLDVATDVPDWGTGDGWPILACEDLFFPQGQRGMWWPALTANIPYWQQYCATQFNMELRVDWAATQFGGIDFSQATNIIFSNGLLDPWHTSGVLVDQAPTVVAIVIPEAAHHLDLRGSHPQDPVYVRAARVKEASLIKQWLGDWLAVHNTSQQRPGPFDPTKVFN